MRNQRGEEARSLDYRGIELHAVRDLLDAQDHVEACKRRAHRADGFAQTAAQAIAIDGTGQGLASDDIAYAPGCLGGCSGNQLHMAAFTAAPFSKHRLERARAGETKRPAMKPGAKPCGRSRQRDC